MSVRSIWKHSLSVWRRYLPSLMLGRTVQLLCLLASAMPLLLCLYPGAEAFMLLALPVYFLAQPLLRYNHAEMLVTAIRDEIYVPLHLADLDGYGRKTLHGFRQFAWHLMGLAPLLACLLYARFLYSGSLDSFTVLRRMADFGGGDWLHGIFAALLVGVLSLIPYAICSALRSWQPHGVALGVQRGFMRGRRKELLTVWLSGLAAYIPFVLAVAVTLGCYIAACPGSVSELLQGTALLPPVDGMLTALCVAVFCLLLPAQCLRQVQLCMWMLAETGEYPRKEETDHDTAGSLAGDAGAGQSLADS